MKINELITKAKSTFGIGEYKVNKLITKINRVVGRNGHKIQWIVIHYVGATGTAKDNCKYFYNVYREASAHYFVGHGGEIWQCVLDKDTAWHCGGGLQGSRGHKFFGKCINSNSLGIELCVKRDGNKWIYSEETIEAAAKLVQAKMKEYGINADHVIRHFDVTGKECPENYLDDKSWRGLHTKLTSAKGSGTSVKPKPSSKPTEKRKTDKIVVDGYWGVATTKKAQKVFKTTVDGVISNQYISNSKGNKGLQSDTWKWSEHPNKSGSQLIKAIQKWVGAKQDGFAGKKTFKKMQQKLGTTQDGVVSSPSQMVKAFQRWLNEQ